LPDLTRVQEFTMTKTVLLISCIAVGRLLVGGTYVYPGDPIELSEQDFEEQLELGNVRFPGSFDDDQAEAAAAAEAERLAAEAAATAEAERIAAEAAAAAEAERLAAEAAATAEAELLAAEQAAAGGDKPARKRS
jgi:hypothetical protein